MVYEDSDRFSAVGTAHDFFQQRIRHSATSTLLPRGTQFSGAMTCMRLIQCVVRKNLQTDSGPQRNASSGRSERRAGVLRVVNQPGLEIFMLIPRV